MKNIESTIQQNCIKWFRLQHRSLTKLLVSVPNGGKRNVITASILKAEGAISGVSDLIFLKQNRFYGCLCIEMKKPNGKQQETQKEWQRAMESAGNKYVICHSLEEFMTEINNYLKDV